MTKDWDQFLYPYELALEELKVKLKGQRAMFRHKNQASPIEFVTGRLKPLDSILSKAEQVQLPLDQLEEMEDIAGLRIMCPFIEDVYQVVDMVRKRQDMEVIREKDYISNTKESGYRSYHLICRYPVYIIDQVYPLLVEIQVRTLAMNFWASIEHSLNYKHQGDYPAEIKKGLQETADRVFQLDEDMSAIRKAISQEETPEKPDDAST